MCLLKNCLIKRAKRKWEYNPSENIWSIFFHNIDNQTKTKFNIINTNNDRYKFDPLNWEVVQVQYNQKNPINKN